MSGLKDVATTFKAACGFGKTVDPNDCWDNTEQELKIVGECGHKPNTTSVITFSRAVKSKIDLLMKAYPSLEWLAYLVGDAETLLITDLIIPEQNVTGASVHVTGPHDNTNVIGVIHSHNTMGAFFSGTDNTYINGNHGISVVVSTTGAKAQIRWITPCGSKLIMEASIAVEKEVFPGEDTFMEKAKENIKVPAPVVYYGGGGYDYQMQSWRGGGGYGFDHKYDKSDSEPKPVAHDPIRSIPRNVTPNVSTHQRSTDTQELIGPNKVTTIGNEFSLEEC